MRRSFAPSLVAPFAAALLLAGCSGYASSGTAASAAPATAAPASAPAAAPAAASSAASAAPSAAMIAEGDSLFNSGGCQRCHGQKGVGAKNAPSLVEGPWLHSKGTMPELIDIITTGVAKEEFKDAARPFAMRPRGGPMNLTDAQVRSVAAYVYSISRGKK